jgi:fructoselysine 6-phosphate deglycase
MNENPSPSPDLPSLVEAAKDSELFTAPILAEDTARFLTEWSQPLRELARSDRSRGVGQLYFVGSGGSYSAMLGGAYLMRRFTRVPSASLLSYDLLWERPPALDPSATAFFASYSGATEDTLAAIRAAREAGARTVAIGRSDDSPIAAEADVTVAYESKDLYGLPLAAVYLYALEHARADGVAEADEVLAGLNEIPSALGAAYRRDQAQGETLARHLLDSQVLYCLGSGALYGLAYKFALTVFMENLRVHGSAIETAEFRHGPAEALERQRMDMFFLVNDDDTRGVSERSIEIARERGARVVAIDARDYEGIHPLLAPFVLLVPLQWFVVYSALLRGILDLDERVLMGRRILGRGDQVTWP